MRQLPPAGGVGNNGGGLKGGLRPCIVSIGCNTKCIFGDADEAGSVKYQTGSQMVRSGN